MVKFWKMSLSASSQALSIRCTLDYPDLDAFIAGYGRNLSPRGIFLPMRDPPAAGTALRFQVELAPGRAVLRGEGEVIWRAPFEAADATRLHGMAVRFVRLCSDSQANIARALAYKAKNPSFYYKPAPDFLAERASVIAVAQMPAAPSPSSLEPARTAATPKAEARIASAPHSPEVAELLALAQPYQPVAVSPSEAAERLEALLARRPC